MLSAHLLYRDRDVDLTDPLPDNAAALVDDLELRTLFAAMGNGDDFIEGVARHTVLSTLTDVDRIRYRHAVVTDAIANASVVREMYDVVAAAIAVESKIFHSRLIKAPEAVLGEARRSLRCFVDPLRRLRKIADRRAGDFSSEGFTGFFSVLQTEIDDPYLATIDDHLQGLGLRGAPLIGVRVGDGNRGTDHAFLSPRSPRWARWPSVGARRTFSFEIAQRDMAGADELGRIRSRGLDRAANAVAAAAEHVLLFFTTLRAELAFCVGAINLNDRLVDKGEPTCSPVPRPTGIPVLETTGLYDVGLSLNLDGRAVGNDVAADGKRLIMITGANQGGKSTILRAIGTAQLMMQSGLFAPARSFSADVRDGIFTHFKREEDEEMESGKLDEELARMDGIVRAMGPASMVLLNESFSSTNEQEGSEIAGQILEAFVDAGVKIVFVTHLFVLADGLYRDGDDASLFLRAERGEDGERTYRIVEGEPLSTSYGEDVYRTVFPEG